MIPFRKVLFLAGLILAVGAAARLALRDAPADSRESRPEGRLLHLHTSARVPLGEAIIADVADAAWHRDSEVVAMTDSGLLFMDFRTKTGHTVRLPESLRGYSAYSWRIAAADSLILMVHPALGVAVAYHTTSRTFGTLSLGPLRRAADVCCLRGRPFIAGKNAYGELVVARLTPGGVDAERMLAIKTANQSFWTPRVVLDVFGDSLLIASGFPRRLYVAHVDLTAYREIPAPRAWINDDGIAARSRSIKELQRQALTRGILAYAVRWNDIYLTLETSNVGRRVLRGQDAHSDERRTLEVAAVFGLVDLDRDRCAFLGIQHTRARVYALQLDVTGPRRMLCGGRDAGSASIVDDHANVERSL